MILARRVVPKRNQVVAKKRGLSAHPRTKGFMHEKMWNEKLHAWNLCVLGVNHKQFGCASK